MIKYQYSFLYNGIELTIAVVGGTAFLLIIYFVQHKRMPKLPYILITIVIASVILIIQNHFIGKRFIRFNTEALTLHLVNGDTINLDRNKGRQIWAINEPGLPCYIWVQYKGGESYRSVSVADTGQCSKDVTYLKTRYGK